MSYLFVSVSSFFFWLAQITRRRKSGLIANNLLPGTKLYSGIFIEKQFLNGTTYQLCANDTVGFFYRDKIYRHELTGEKASPEDIESIFRYLANKIDECEEMAKKLNALQRGLSE